MRQKVVHSREAFEKMQEVYERRGLFVVQTTPEKVEAFDDDGKKRHELVLSEETNER